VCKFVIISTFLGVEIDHDFQPAVMLAYTDGPIDQICRGSVVEPEGHETLVARIDSTVTRRLWG